jgi:8-oxo-dGTP pyrophosphatase MutT (NUDIX family)
VVPKKSVLVYLVDDGKVCLGMKKVRYSQGKWNGFGGKIEAGESEVDAAIREVKEESGVDIESKDLTKKASFYYFETPEDWTVEVFICHKWKGEIEESDEMQPNWFDIDKLPFEQMWENDALWIKEVLTSKKQLKGTFWHDNEGKVTKYKLE